MPQSNLSGNPYAGRILQLPYETQAVCQMLLAIAFELRTANMIAADERRVAADPELAARLGSTTHADGQEG